LGCRINDWLNEKTRDEKMIKARLWNEIQPLQVSNHIQWNPCLMFLDLRFSPHLMLNFSNLKSVVSLLNYLHSRFSSVQCSNPPLTKKTLNRNFTLHEITNRTNTKSRCFASIYSSISSYFLFTHFLQIQKKKDSKNGKSQSWKCYVRNVSVKINKQKRLETLGKQGGSFKTQSNMFCG
jgi:hypothetical protein